MVKASALLTWISRLMVREIDIFHVKILIEFSACKTVVLGQKLYSILHSLEIKVLAAMITDRDT
jgi:hypothetical protein